MAGSGDAGVAGGESDGATDPSAFEAVPASGAYYTVKYDFDNSLFRAGQTSDALAAVASEIELKLKPSAATASIATSASPRSPPPRPPPHPPPSRASRLPPPRPARTTASDALRQLSTPLMADAASDDPSAAFDSIPPPPPPLPPPRRAPPPPPPARKTVPSASVVSAAPSVGGASPLVSPTIRLKSHPLFTLPVRLTVFVNSRWNLLAVIVTAGTIAWLSSTSAEFLTPAATVIPSLVGIAMIILQLIRLDTRLFRALTRTFEWWYLVTVSLTQVSLSVVNSYLKSQARGVPLRFDHYLLLFVPSGVSTVLLVSLDGFPTVGFRYKVIVLGVFLLNIGRIFVTYWIGGMKYGAEFCWLYCTDTVSLNLSCLSTLAFFYVKYLVKLIYYTARETEPEPVIGAPAASPAADTLESSNRPTPLLTLRTKINLTVDASSQRLYIVPARDFVMDLAEADLAERERARELSAVDTVSLTSTPKFARRRLILLPDPLLDPLRYPIAEWIARLRQSVWYDRALVAFFLLVVINGGVGFISGVATIFVIFLPFLVFFAFEIVTLHRALVWAVLRSFDAYFVFYQILVHVIAALYGRPSTGIIDWVVSVLILWFAVVALLLFEAQPRWLAAPRMRVLVITLFVLNTIRLFATDLFGTSEFNDRDVCVLWCSNTRKVSIDAVFQITVFAVRYGWTAAFRPLALTTLKLPVLQYIE